MERKISSSAPVSATWGRPTAAQYSIPASGAPARNPNFKCCDGAPEGLCSACVCCVCCPLALVWGCLRLPWRAAKQAKKWVGGGSEEKPLAYSSFSDIDSSGEV